MKKEKWVPVLGFEGLYEVSSLGRIKSLQRSCKSSRGNSIRSVPEKIIKQSTLSTGYKHISLCKNGKVSQFVVHRVVWGSFNGSIPNGIHINHLNGNRADNGLINLDDCTQTENNYWTMVKGRHPRKLLSKSVVIKIFKDNRSQRKIAAAFGCQQATVGSIKKKRIYKYWVGEETNKYAN